MLSGSLDAKVGDQRKIMGSGDILYVPKGSPYRIGIPGGPPVRYIVVSSKQNLEASISKT